MADKQKKQRLAQWVIILAAFLIYFSLSCFLPVSKAPDEIMRYDISNYIFEHHSLPVGYDEEIRNGLWGFSYAFTPYLPSMLAAGIMAVVSVFDSSLKAMIIASRFVSVMAATGCVWLGFRIGEKLFPEFEDRMLYTVSIGFLPQLVFLAAYLNNDIFAVFTSMLILLGWLYGKERHWDYRSCLFLGLGLSLCALTYYNAYAWILCSILYYFGCILQDGSIEKKWKYVIVHVSAIALTVFALAGWFFIRNAFLYNGDILGIGAQKACGELYAVDALKPSNRATWANQGKTVWNMLAETEWIAYSVKSFFACFGALDIWVSLKYYICYGAIVCISGLGFLYGGIKRKWRTENLLLYICCVICMVIPIILSVINSYSSDYQAQGRYLMPALPALMLFVVKGIRQLDRLPGKRRQYAAITVCALWLLCFVMIFAKVMVPQLYVGIY